MQKFKSVEELVNQLKPEKPVYCIRKSSIESAVTKLEDPSEKLSFKMKPKESKPFADSLKLELILL